MGSFTQCGKAARVGIDPMVMCWLVIHVDVEERP